jgi:hypothetical protein
MGPRWKTMNLDLVLWSLTPIIRHESLLYAPLDVHIIVECVTFKKLIIMFFMYNHVGGDHHGRTIYEK